MRVMSLARIFLAAIGDSHIPVFRPPKHKHTESSSHCYSVWLRHLVMTYENKLTNDLPCIVAELGPGKSLGTLLTALISSAHTCYAFDIVQHFDTKSNLRVFDDPVDLLCDKDLKTSGAFIQAVKR